MKDALYVKQIEKETIATIYRDNMQKYIGDNYIARTDRNTM